MISMQGMTIEGGSMRRAGGKPDCSAQVGPDVASHRLRSKGSGQDARIAAPGPQVNVAAAQLGQGRARQWSSGQPQQNPVIGRHGDIPATVWSVQTTTDFVVKQSRLDGLRIKKWKCP